jgi:hypothetical protein
VIYDVTSTYIHSEDRSNICFQVLDRRLNPIDGVRVTVIVFGLRDITFIRNEFLNFIEKIWYLIPQFLKFEIVQKLYEKISDRITQIPNSIESPIFTIWNFTDINGKCNFNLGNNKNYVFIVQHGMLKNPLLPALYNKIRLLKEPIDKNYVILFPFYAPIKKMYKEINIPSGDIKYDISFDTESYQIQKSIISKKDLGVHEKSGKIDFFIVDTNNFDKYSQGLEFECYSFFSDSSANISINTVSDELYFVFRNDARKSNIILDFTLSVKQSTVEDSVSIVQPNTSLFEKPIFSIGENIVFTGIATDNITLNVNEITQNITIQNYEWSYKWITTGLQTGIYTIKAQCGDIEDIISIELIDVTPPELIFDMPHNYDIVEHDIIQISGKASDNNIVQKVEVKIDNNEYRLAEGTEFWYIEWDISEFDLGNHIIRSRAYDTEGNIGFNDITIVKNESNHSWGPVINDLYHKPENPNNISNVIIYTNVTSVNPFMIKKVDLYWEINENINSEEMFLYASNPVQGRHEEDPLINESNNPIFGLELGQFSTGKNVTYWIEAFDTANNKITSTIKSFAIE